MKDFQKDKKENPVSSEKKEAQILYIVAGAIFVMALVLLTWYFIPRNSVSSTIFGFYSEEKKEEQKICPYRRLLDGVCVSQESDVNPTLISVMLENHPAARPQAGLAAARVVYEVPVEANYTRFLALFPIETSLERVGPVRSARPYFLDWVQEYGKPVYMHVGGSDDALQKISASGIRDVNEFYKGWYFWRASDKYAPHNVYTSSALWQKVFTDYFAKEDEPVDFTSWVFVTSTPAVCAESCVSTITTSFLPPTYEAVWKFVTSTGEYERYQMGQSHRDENGETITASTVIIQEVSTTVLDSVGRISMKTVGSGKASVFHSGNVFEGTWKKSSVTGRTEWLDATGSPIALVSGKIWIEVVPQSGSSKKQ